MPFRYSRIPRKSRLPDGFQLTQKRVFGLNRFHRVALHTRPPKDAPCCCGIHMGKDCFPL
jgi:hypothetical protein